MSLETVVEDIRAEARSRAEEVREEADERAAAIVSDAESDAETIREDRLAEVEREIERERERRLSSAKLEAKQERLAARREVLEDVRQRVEAGVEAIDGETREKLTRALVEAAAREFEDVTDETVEVDVYGRADDRELIESILSGFDGFTFAGEYDCLGGVVVESEASRVRVNNTFDSILEAVWEDSLRDVSSRLFDESDQ